MDISLQLQDEVNHAIANQYALQVIGSGSKAFYGNTISTQGTISTAKHVGVLAYKPQQGYLTARSGTTLESVEQLLAEQGQMLAFEPPNYSPVSTLGGMVAAGLSGSTRPWQGSLRDHVLAIKMINGHGRILHFTQQHKANPASNPDFARLMAGSLGTLGVILEVTLKVVPQPEAELTTTLELPIKEALDYCLTLQNASLPLAGVSYFEDCLYIRLRGNDTTIHRAYSKIGGDLLPAADEYWQSLRHQSHEFFQQYHRPLWRLSLHPSTPSLAALESNTLIDWAGAQRWVYSNIPPNLIRTIASKNEGYATLFRGNLPGVNAFQPLPKRLLELHYRIKQLLDPQHIFNPGRLYSLNQMPTQYD